MRHCSQNSLYEYTARPSKIVTQSNSRAQVEEGITQALTLAAAGGPPHRTSQQLAGVIFGPACRALQKTQVLHSLAGTTPVFCKCSGLFVCIPHVYIQKAVQKKQAAARGCVLTTEILQSGSRVASLPGEQGPVQEPAACWNRRALPSTSPAGPLLAPVRSGSARRCC